VQQWLTKLCTGRHGMTINYDATLGEPTAVADAAKGLSTSHLPPGLPAPTG
jgi:hypothetical protein